MVESDTLTFTTHYLPAFPRFRPVERSVTFGAKLGGQRCIDNASVDMDTPIMQAVTPISRMTPKAQSNIGYFSTQQSWPARQLPGRQKGDSTSSRGATESG